MNSVVTYPSQQIDLKVLAYEHIDLGAVSTGLNATMAKQCFRAFIKTDGGGLLRYRVDGVAPTDVEGKHMYDGEQLDLSQYDAINFRAIRVGSTNPQLRVEYRRSWP